MLVIWRLGLIIEVIDKINSLQEKVLKKFMEFNKVDKDICKIELILRKKNRNKSKHILIFF